jgi:hypothetical protein
VNAFAGKELITYDEKQALRDKRSSGQALKSILEKIRALGKE